jgi:metal-responsive CopG/Arc/MetJ family transcriptional regulator
MLTMSNKNFGVSFPEEMIERIDAERGDVSRSKYLLRIVENYGHSKIKSAGSLNLPLNESAA